MDVTHAELAAIFTEWHRRWTDDPAGYATEAEFLAQPDDEYGDSAARYFLKIVKETA